MQVRVHTPPLVADVVRDASARQHCIDERTAHAFNAKFVGLNDGVWPHAVGLAPDEYRIRLRPQQTHSTAILITGDIEVVVAHRTDAPIKAHCCVCKYSHEDT